MAKLYGRKIKYVHIGQGEDKPIQKCLVLTEDEVEALKTDVAREIFEEIEQWFNTRIDFYEEMKFRASLGFDKEQYEYAKTSIANLKIYRAEIAELKKKYTEASDEKA